MEQGIDKADSVAVFIDNGQVNGVRMGNILWRQPGSRFAGIYFFS